MIPEKANKPKFIPSAKKKIKSEPIENDSNGSDMVTASTNISTEQKFKVPSFIPQQVTHRKKPDTNQNRGRSRWVTPTGEAFFTGFNTSIKSRNPIVKHMIKPPGYDESYMNQMNNESTTNNRTTYISSSSSSAANHAVDMSSQPQVHRPSPVSYTPSQQMMIDHYCDSDSDDSDVEYMYPEAKSNTTQINTSATAGVSSSASSSIARSSHTNKEEEIEIWPPKYYNSQAPLSIPFGPKTTTAREQLAALPILADPHDDLALEHEENNVTFLLQMPSELRIKPHTQYSRSDPMNPNNPMTTTTNTTTATTIPMTHPTIIDTTTDNTNSTSTTTTTTNMNYKDMTSLYDQAGYLHTGKIGKLQLMKSGKVYLITSNGLKFEMWSGMDVAFAQYVVSIDLNKPPHPSTMTPMTSSTMDNMSPNMSQNMSSTPIMSYDDYSKMTLSTTSSSQDIKPDIKTLQGIQNKSNVTSTNTSSTQMSREGDFYMLADITRKLILTPTHLIGNKNLSSTHTGTTSNETTNINTTTTTATSKVFSMNQYGMRGNIQQSTYESIEHRIPLSSPAYTTTTTSSNSNSTIQDRDSSINMMNISEDRMNIMNSSESMTSGMTSSKTSTNPPQGILKTSTTSSTSSSTSIQSIPPTNRTLSSKSTLTFVPKTKQSNNRKTVKIEENTDIMDI